MFGRIEMHRLSHRYCQKRTFQLCYRQLSTHLLKNISSTTSQRNWKNDTPAGGLTEIMVYEPDPHVSWPDPTLGIFAKSDEKFLLPGNVGGGPSRSVEDIWKGKLIFWNLHNSFYYYL